MALFLQSKSLDKKVLTADDLTAVSERNLVRQILAAVSTEIGNLTALAEEPSSEVGGRQWAELIDIIRFRLVELETIVAMSRKKQS